MAERELFPSNKPKNEELIPQKNKREHAKPVAKRIQTKETFGQKFKKDFLAEDVNDIGGYLWHDLIIPNLKDTFLNFLYAALWGDRRSGSYTYRDTKGRERRDYSGISRAGRVNVDRDRERREPSSERKDFNLDNIVLRTREEADIVLTKMEDYMLEYGQVTVGYLYELLGESCPYTAEYYGWRDLDRASVKRVRDGCQLILPRPVRIES